MLLGLVIFAILLFNPVYLGMIVLGFIIVIASVKIHFLFIQRFTVILGVFLIILGLFLIRSVPLFVAIVILFYLMFVRDDKDSSIYFGDGELSPFAPKQDYYGIKLIQPQTDQIKIKEKQVKGKNQMVFHWDDVNLQLLGGSTIIDLGNTIIPKRETHIVIQKIWGKTRIIVPSDVGLRLNISTFDGKVYFENESVHLNNENYQWKSQDYDERTRKINLILSTFVGNVEVITL